MHRNFARYAALTLLAGALLLAIVPVTASTTAPGRQVWDSDDGPSPVEVTNSVHCQVVKIQPNRTLRVRHETGEARIHINKKVRIRAKARKQFEGRKKLAFADFSPGQWLKLTYVIENGYISSVKVLPKAPAGFDISVWTEGAETATLVDDSK